MQQRSRIGRVIALVVCFFLGTCLVAMAEKCVVCGEELSGYMYWATNQTSHESKRICPKCSLLTNYCTLCGWPAGDDGLKLPDGRLLCGRDAKGIILDPNDAERICAEAKNDLDRLFSRFLVFPANVELAIVDRTELSNVSGSNHECAGFPGCIQAVTNGKAVKYKISLMSALSRDDLMGVCAHEYSHAWIMENVSTKRRETLSRDTKEGFCELLACMLMDSQRKEEAKNAILQSSSTHGQAGLFAKVERSYGFNDIEDWMKFGTDTRLDANDLSKIKDIDIPRPTVPVPVKKIAVTNIVDTAIVANIVNPSPEPGSLVFMGAFRTNGQTVAIINDSVFGIGEGGRVRIGKTNVAIIYCLSIQKNLARVQIVTSGQVWDLPLTPRK